MERMAYIERVWAGEPTLVLFACILGCKHGTFCIFESPPLNRAEFGYNNCIIKWPGAEPKQFHAEKFSTFRKGTRKCVTKQDLLELTLC